jgi:hypothetical protein
VRAIEENDEAKIEEAILRLSRSRRLPSPLAFAVGAFVRIGATASRGSKVCDVSSSQAFPVACVLASP